MLKRLALVHTVGSLIPTFKGLCTELIPHIDLFNMVDESLLQNCIREGHLTPDTSRRLAQLIVSAQDAGADMAMVTCSSVGPAVELSRPFVSIPVFRVDEPMANEAVRLGTRIGVAATLRTTLEPTISLLKARANAAGKHIEVLSAVCDGAFDAVIAGDTPTHDAIVGKALRDLCEKCEVVVLAQASMARVADGLPSSQRGNIPILSSPRLAVQFLAEVVKRDLARSEAPRV
jgi:Asp/Glu/hydantoin racemase